ncbi:mercury(II) reductase [Ornithinimicrobium cerasi]|uniref:mercury(II) reductase n=1 Tax=Ornithinimicrobium cerasi TaxID=2248773 RepID=UPI003B029BE8
MTATAKGGSYDLAVIGSGGAAFAAAIRATSLGKRVVMIERGTVGGTCVNTGCVPSKALLAAAEARHVTLDTARFPGLPVPGVGPVEMPALVAGKDELVGSLRGEKYVDLATEYGWDLLPGEATFVGTPTEPALRVTGPGGTVKRVRAARYLIATGSTPWVPPVPGLQEAGYLTSTTAMELDHVPESLLVIGGGYVAMEQAQLFARLGARVTMLVRSRLASHEEPEAATALQEIFADEGIQIIRGAVPTAVRRDQAAGEVAVTATTAGGGSQELRGAEVLVATGRRPVIGTLGLDTVDVRTGDHGAVVVDNHLRTTNTRIWAAGDVTAHPQFVYVAAAHGTIVADNALTGAGREVDYRHLPRVVFTSPALATVGMTGQQASATGIRYDSRVLSLAHVPRAIVNRDTRGLIKMVTDADTGRIIGITALAQDAGDLAAAGVYILDAGMTTDQVANLWSPYLTMAEGLKLTAQAFTTDITKLSCCAG